MKNKRASGILCPITALPGIFGIGDFGHSAYEFCDFLKTSGQHYWEILPINSLFGRSGITAHTPYGATSCFAGNILLISPQRLLLDGHLDALPVSDFDPHQHLERIADYNVLYHYKWKMIEKAFAFSGPRVLASEEFLSFKKKQAYWLELYTSFELLSKLHGTPEQVECDFRKWPAPLRQGDKLAVQEIRQQHERECQLIEYSQFLFFSQWYALKHYANQRGVQIIGDLPIYSNSKSADLWSYKKFFKLDENDDPTHTGGTPPDVFSSVGQNWKSPVYDWDYAKENHFQWHRERVRHQLQMFDILRLDHFQGYVNYWEIPAQKNPCEGAWREIPSDELFQAFVQDSPDFRVVVEDLGALTPKAKKIMRDFHLAGMNVLEYAFHEEDSSYQPHHHLKHSVCFVGTHDNTTALGLLHSASKEYLHRLSEYVGHALDKDHFHWEMMRLCLSSPSNMAILQVQDLLGLDENYRTNDPLSYIKGEGKEKNWTFRIKNFKELYKIEERLLHLTKLFGRYNRELT